MAAAFWRIGFGVEEFLRFLAGVVALWGPFAAMLFLLLERVPDRLVRGALSCIGSYALTTLVYFGCAWIGAGWVLYLLQAAAVIRVAQVAVGRRYRCRELAADTWVVNVLARARGRWQFREFPGLLAKVDGLLLLLIALSLLVTSPVKIIFNADPATGQHEYRLNPDHMFHAGQSYELSRHVPPSQSSIRGGTPERAYHLFPHLTTMLLGRYTGQSDLLRAHVVYHLTIIEVLMCFGLFSIARIITGVGWAGYVSIALMYPLAAAWPKLIDNGAPFLYFTLFPHASSGLELVELVATQMYSGLLVMYGVLLAVLLISDNLADNDPADPPLLLIAAIMAAALVRFRVHIFLVLFPAFLLVMLYCWLKRREKWYLAAAGAGLLVSLALYWEMKSPAYLKDMATLKLGLSWFAEKIAFIDTWPLAKELKGLFPQGTFTGRLLWEVVSVPMFVLCNVIGLPLLAMTVVFLRSEAACGRFKLFSFTIVWATVMSVLMGLFLTTEFDAWSLGGQLLLHSRWYLLPLEGAVLCLLFLRWQAGLAWPQEMWTKAGVVMVVLVMLVAGWRFFLHEPEGPAMLREVRIHPAAKVTFTPDEWQALLYLRKNAPPDAVIISNRYTQEYFYPISGIAGRTAFLTQAGEVLDRWAMKLNPDDNRLAIIKTLWTTTDRTVFNDTISKTGATLLFEDAKVPLKIHPSANLRRWWQGPAGQVTIWQISGR